MVAKWRCKICGYVYDEERGESRYNIPPNTRFEELPEDFKCPICGAGKDAFEKLE